MSKNKMNEHTIKDAVEIVLKDHPEGLTNKQIYKEIVDRKLYTFSTKTPAHVVLVDIRRHCEGVEMASSSLDKKYYIVNENEDGDVVYALLSSRKKEKAANKETVESKTAEITDEELLEKAYQNYRKQIGQILLEMIMNSSPAFFERLVLELLLKMGYGYDLEAGIITGKPHDHGIDGIIHEDKLGLDKIYIQAKRYAVKNTIGSKELQAFVGAMQNINKGVFITTSTYTHEANNYYEKIKNTKQLILIDGNELINLLIDHEVGVRRKKDISILEIDRSYFE